MKIVIATIISCSINICLSQELNKSISLELEKNSFIKKAYKDEKDNIKIHVSNKASKTNKKKIDIFTFDKDLNQIEKQSKLGFKYIGSKERYIINDNITNYITEYDERTMLCNITRANSQDKKVNLDVGHDYNIRQIFEHSENLNIIVRNKKLSTKTTKCLSWYVYDKTLSQVSKTNIQTPKLKKNINWFYLHHSEKLIQYKLDVKDKNSKKLTLRTNIISKDGILNSLTLESSHATMLTQNSLAHGYPLFNNGIKNEIYLIYPNIEGLGFILDVFSIDGDLKYTLEIKTHYKYRLTSDGIGGTNESIEFIDDNTIGIKFAPEEYFIFNTDKKEINSYTSESRYMSSKTPPSIFFIKDKLPNIYKEIKWAVEYKGNAPQAILNNYISTLSINNDKYIIAQIKNKIKIIKYND